MRPASNGQSRRRLTQSEVVASGRVGKAKHDWRIAIPIGFVVLWSCFSVMNMSHNNTVVVLKEETDTAPAVEQANLLNINLCESPSLPRGSIHVVVAAYKYNATEHYIGFDDNNYLWDLGLTNADIFWYKRVEPEQPLRSVDGPCGMSLHERLLLPNYGRDGAAFFDHVLEVYDNPPKSIVFLHGHAAIAWHTSCESVFARTAYVYRDLASAGNNTNNTVQNHMMTLTSSENGTLDFALNWFGVVKKPFEDKDALVNGTRRRLLSTTSTNQTKSSSPCILFKERWHEQVFSKLSSPTFHSCCASFIVPGERIQRYSRAFYQDLQSVLVDQRNKDQGTLCFEFIVYWLFGDDRKQFTTQDLQVFYDEADGLVHGTNRSKTALEPDKTVLSRMKGCAPPQGVLRKEEEDYRRYVRRRKWRNTWRHFGFYRTQEEKDYRRYVQRRKWRNTWKHFGFYKTPAEPEPEHNTTEIHNATEM